VQDPALALVEPDQVPLQIYTVVLVEALWDTEQSTPGCTTRSWGHSTETVG